MNALYDEGLVHHHKIVDEKNNTTHKFPYANNFPLNLLSHVND
ncbi:hypothetical protein [Salinisphaera sp. G21_0]|nr:hypothetical protein [Salinisphaera sp. G21_0]